MAIRKAQVIEALIGQARFAILRSDAFKDIHIGTVQYPLFAYPVYSFTYIDVCRFIGIRTRGIVHRYRGIFFQAAVAALGRV